ncbi:hypothetical protein SpCBS45565_g07155 [Spizellomyces sp. 'palustris']|nr:hypothetical protein SpCBS45565_g07155 [Spizellomyces sp. 'palustris']
MPTKHLNLLTIPIDCLLCILSHLPLTCISNLSYTSKVFRETLRSSATHIYNSRIPTSISPHLLKVYKTSRGHVPFTEVEIDVESRCRRGISSVGRNDPDPVDGGAVYYFLLRRHKTVIEACGDVLKRLVGDQRARRVLVENARRFGEVESTVDDGHVGEQVVLVEAVRALVMLQWTVETLRLMGCAATKASRSTPGYSLVGSRYVRLILRDFDSIDLRVMYHAVMNLGSKSFTKPSGKWRSDAQGFEVHHFELIYLRPFLKKTLADRGDWTEEV